jgi:hypothetical protein
MTPFINDQFKVKIYTCFKIFYTQNSNFQKVTDPMRGKNIIFFVVCLIYTRQPYFLTKSYNLMPQITDTVTDFKGNYGKKKTY